jgi:hypothetical protein
MRGVKRIETKSPLVCNAGPAAEAFVGSLPSVKNIALFNDNYL